MQIDLESQLTLSEAGEGTKLTWSSETTKLKGLVATLSKGLIQGAAEKVIGDTWQKIRAELGEV